MDNIETLESFTFWIHMLGTIAFAVTAVLVVAPLGIDLFGATIMGVITAVGGGTIRDVILEVPVFWSTDLGYIWVASIASIITFYSNSLLSKKHVNRAMLFVDAAGVSLFGIEAVNKVWGLEFGIPIGPIILGVVTAIGGGLMRDVLAGRKNLLMSKELYAIPVMLGCTLYVLILEFLPQYAVSGGFVCIALIFIMRSAAIMKNLSVPDWLVANVKTK
jgi:uncharacterized membrane protein YeiH